MTPRKLSRVIQQLREAKGMTQRDLAKKAEVTAGYIAQLETGRKKNPSVPVLRRIARALAVDVADLL